MDINTISLLPVHITETWTARPAKLFVVSIYIIIDHYTCYNLIRMTLLILVVVTGEFVMQLAISLEACARILGS